MFEITTLLIPGENDSASEIEAESAWIMDRLGPDVPLHFSTFHPDWKLVD
jgi:pyruvate formate lyase activating enzyme